MVMVMVVTGQRLVGKYGIGEAKRSMRTQLKFDRDERMKSKLFHPEDRFITQWNKCFLLSSVVALALDPLFLYTPIVNGAEKCLDMDRPLAIVVCVLRSFADILYIFHIIIKFRTMSLTSSHFEFGRGEYIDKPLYVAKHYLKSYFIMDVLAALPLPQFAVFVIIRNLDRPSSFSKENILKFVIFSQYLLRVLQTSLFYQKVTKFSGFVIEKAWAGAAFNFFLYVLASHVVGALWYLFAIESEMRCWHIACKRHNSNSKYLYCGKGRVTDYGFLKTSCPLLERKDIKQSIDFDFGIFLDALLTRILETRDFRQKILYCSLWGLQSLSSLGQGLKASTFCAEILFADFVAVIGLVLFSLLIGNMQKYLQSLSNLTHRMEEMKEKWREAEDLMSHMSLPEALRQRVRRDKQYKWKITLGVELDSFFRDLPQDLRRDIKRHLCSTLLKKVPVFKQMDDILLDAVCDRLKQVLYTQKSFIVRKGEPAREMLFITRGEVEVQRYITDDETFGYLNSRNLKAGDFFGEELLIWVSDPKSQQLPFYTRTVQAVTNVQAFTLLADDLLFVASQFSSFHSRRVQYAFRFCSQEWRTWAACCIQSAWRRHCQRKHEKILMQEANKRRQDALVTV